MAKRRSRSPRRRFGVWGAIGNFLGGSRRTTERTTRARTTRSGNNTGRSQQDGGQSTRSGTSDRRRRDEASNAGTARPDSSNTVQRWVNAVPSRAAPPSQVSAPASSRRQSQASAPASSRHQSQSSRTHNAAYGQYTRGRPSSHHTSHQRSESEESERSRHRGSRSRHGDGHDAHHEEMIIRYPINSSNPMDAPQIQYSSGRRDYGGQEATFFQYPTYSSNPMDAPQFGYGSGWQDSRDGRRR